MNKRRKCKKYEWNIRAKKMEGEQKKEKKNWMKLLCRLSYFKNTNIFLIIVPLVEETLFVSLSSREVNIWH